MPHWFPAGQPAHAYFCVVGCPVEHSKSPQIHAAFAAQFGRSLIYDKVEVAAGELAAALAEFRAYGGRGMNITVPLKAEAWALADVRSARAAVAGAANTLWFDEQGRVVVDNTDGAGLVRDLTLNLDCELRDSVVLLLGVGGAGRGVIPALLDAGVAMLQLSNRSAHKVDEIIAASSTPERLCAVPWGAVPASRQPDLIINATSLSLHGELPPLDPAVLSHCRLCYDMMYSSEPTVFARWAERHGVARASDGLGMLVEQAAEAYAVWHGEQPVTGPVIRSLRTR